MGLLGFFIVLLSVPVIIGVLILLFMVVSIILLRAKRLVVREDVVETYQLPNYAPALEGYLVNYQKIGEREIYATIFDLISEDVLNIEKTHSINTNQEEYKLIDNSKNCNKTLNEFEDHLIWWMYKDGEKSISLTEIGNKIHEEKHYSKNYKYFLKKVQYEAKRKDLFSKKHAKIKNAFQSVAEFTISVYEAIKPVIKMLAIAIPIMMTFAVIAISINDLKNGKIEKLIDVFAKKEDVISFIAFVTIPVIELGSIYLLQFLFTYFYNIFCYSNELSENGKEEYSKCIGLKNFINNYSLIKEHSIMGVKIWKKYYAYAIVLKCSDKFFDQLKEMKIADESIDVALVELFEYVISNIKDSIKEGIKHVSTDAHGGTHIDY